MAFGLDQMGSFHDRKLRVQPHRPWPWEDRWRLCGLSRPDGIMRYLLGRFPNLSGFECDPSLQYARTNPGPQNLLPGGYTNEFITGPMVSPNVWGSLAAAGKGDAGGEYLTGRWYSASALDYYFRKH